MNLLANSTEVTACQYSKAGNRLLHPKTGPSDPTQRWHSELQATGVFAENSFNEEHILAISQAISDVGIEKNRWPLFLGMDTHALSEPAFATALEVFAANNVTVMFQKGLRYTPTPVISHAILTYNGARKKGLADGIVITPSHNRRRWRI